MKWICLKGCRLLGAYGVRYGTTSFQHMVDRGYDAQFYGYLFADVIAADAFGRFEEEGLFDDEVALEFRRLVFESGASLPLLDAFRQFRGREPKADAFVRSVTN